MKKFLFLPLLLVAVTGFAKDVLLDTMQSELNRNFNILKKQEPPVYYLSYYVVDGTSYYIAASLGDILFNDFTRSRKLNVDARSGSRRLDNTHEFKDSNEDTLSLATYNIPLDDNAAALKNVFWRVTQEESKKAQDQFLKVKTNSAVKAENTDKSDDFSAPVKPVSFYSPITPQEVDTANMQARLREYSALVKDYPFVLDSRFVFSSDANNRYIVTSEGSSVVEGGTLVRLSYTITTRNEDGMTLERTNSYDGFDVSDLPSSDVIKAQIKQDLETLKVLRNAPVVEPFTGPVILKNRASGVFFHEILGHRVEGHRQKSESFGQTFTQKVGQVIVSPILTVRDDPTLSHFNGVPLRGYYQYDDDGIKSQNVNIIQNGVLKNFLMGRSPIKNFPYSNGHGRKDLGFRTVSRMGNTIVSATNPVSFDKLKQMLKDEIKKQNKPYGLIIDDISGGFTMIDRNNPQSFKVKPLLVYRVYADGRPDEIVRGLDIVGTPLASFGKVVAAADDAAVFNGTCGAESGWVPVSAISPSVLLSELEVEKVQKTAQRLPILPNPAGGK